MKGVEDPEFILLRKARELKKRLGDAEEINELIEMAEGIIDQNIKGALLYILTAMDQTELKDRDIYQELFSQIIEKRRREAE